MDKEYYKKPICSHFNFIKWVSINSIKRSLVLKNKWEPFLSDYLTRISDEVSIDSEFYPEEIESNEHFINFFNRRDEAGKKPLHSAVVLKGSVGVGKTSFINWWENQEGRSHLSSRIDINHDRLYEKGEDFTKTAINVQKKLALNLTQKLHISKEFNKEFRNIIKYVRSAAFAETYDNFERHFVNQSDEFLDQFPSLGPGILLACIVLAANNSLKSPVWLIIDNVDLEKPEVQYDYIRSAYCTYEEIKNYINQLQCEPEFHVIVTARPETCKSWQNYFNNFQDVEYIRPNVLNIAQKRLHNAIKNSSKATGVSMPSVTISGTHIADSLGLADHISRCISSSLSPARWPWGDDPNSFHIALVNNNVRRFINSWVHFILSGNFLNLWAFPENGTRKEPSPYTYLSSIIKGPYNNYIGNDRIDGSGDRSDSPLFFNLYGLPLKPGVSHRKFCQHYFIYLRILQYLYLHNSGVIYPRVINDLSPFFDVDTLITSIKFLLWARMIDEVTTGARNIGGYSSFELIDLNDVSKLKSNDATKLYIQYLVSDYTYVSTMSLVSLQLTNRENNDMTYSEPFKRHQATLAFLNSHLNILICNLKDYKQDNKLDKFKDLFISKGEEIRPWLNSVNSSIATSKSFLKFFNEQENRDFTNEIKQTSVLLNKYIELKSLGIERIKKYVDDIYE